MSVAAAFPAGSCDTHLHIYDRRYPAAATTVLRPPDASLVDYRHFAEPLGLTRFVLVQPSTYGLDNSCQLDAIAPFGDRARAIVVVDETVTESELDRLTALGARGARFHMLPGGALGWEQLRPVAERIAAFGWHIQLQMNGHALGDRLAELLTLPTPLVIDHVARFMPPTGPDRPEFEPLRRVIDNGRCWVKLSAPYESAPDAGHRYAQVSECIASLVEQAAERMLWASNWPHPGQADPPGAADLSRLIAEWLPDAAIRHRILVDNPAEVYGFPA